MCYRTWSVKCYLLCEVLCEVWNTTWCPVLSRNGFNRITRKAWDHGRNTLDLVSGAVEIIWKEKSLGVNKWGLRDDDDDDDDDSRPFANTPPLNNLLELLGFGCQWSEREWWQTVPALIGCAGVGAASFFYPFWRYLLLCSWGCSSCACLI